ncbi:beta-ketoacyl-[acyl-carrier-protein] synthase family protein [Paenibacillus larvae]|uniref:3-oxoacyl-[acyl-carrier-protein] synthase n=4 Tax=Paenibacillus larvae TaxID=1464 RepID=V9W4A3_9BACL|nr:beta-ketoacyl-[acyl-carrier-protein] synthase family protein [Paenibacillus larvae]AHD04759.1 3-oxoacyl-[acyl-carrier-protein] synthase [Paenibacillus larvae subsp. larvae DSM 25430]AVF23038.1 3-oxoacyl-[acyl-carrier-protein] synthase [Paenibacillus larvae subsp. larvae]AVG11303.1 3-oxoacyl-[acyl-carrier-protein] synthase [Paenibacillus larvae subsp. larvae DSM 25430]ETK26293.1 3-oxoacyl-[acyl-carrier-protein] synthase [Paenibacillus larvae subsp. larvae DSM 25719]MCY7491028.1 beta-ketoacyl
MNTNKQRIVVTGMGIICPNGKNLDEFWERVKAGKSGIKVVNNIDMSDMLTNLGGEIADFNPEDYFSEEELKEMDRCGQLGVVAAREAVKHANLQMESLNPYRVGISLGTSLGGMLSGEEFHEQWLKKGIQHADEALLYKYLIHTPCDNITRALGMKGPKMVISNACAAGTNSIGYALDIIRNDKADVMITGGVDPLSRLSLSGFNSLQALIPTPPSPYSKSNGIVIGEGAAILVLEKLEHALERGASILAEVLDYDLSSDAYHQTAPDPGGEGALRSMQGALRKANVESNVISYINGHGTGTPANDMAEPKAILSLIGDNKIPVSSTKSMIGHMLGAGGAAEAVTSILAIQHGFLPPTINFDIESQKFDLDFVPNEGRDGHLDYVLSNSFAFGGNNASILFRKYQDGKERRVEKPAKKVVITGIGALAGNAANLEEVKECLLQGKSGVSTIEKWEAESSSCLKAGQIPELNFRKMIHPNLLRKMDTISRNAVVSAKMALEHGKLKIDRDNREKIGIIFATSTGPIETVESFNRIIIQEGVKSANAKLFPNTVMNAAAGHISLNFKVKGPTSTVSCGNVSGISALYYAYSLIQSSDYDTFIVVASDEVNKPIVEGHSKINRFLTSDEIQPFDSNRSGTILGEGSVAFIIESEEAALRRNAAILAELKGFGLTSDDSKIGSMNHTGEAWKTSMEMAMSEAAVSAGDIGYIGAAANGHPYFDSVEERVIQDIFGNKVPVSASKSVFGETFASSGLLSLISALCAFDGKIPPTQNVTSHNGRIDLVTEQARDAEIDHALISTYSYGGNYNTVVIGKYGQ